ncbi:C1 family peptidase [Roseateles sp. DC23W]|uniref:C1 family peptidase n=1 Tax=Pelomonas dachongensis TaxID=3299029 RepID=A0ABW7EIW0_9BURK
MVEHDLRGAWEGIRDQGPRPTCLACTTSDAHAHAHGLSHALSAEYLFAHAVQLMSSSNGGLSFDAVDKALQLHGQPHESHWPYGVPAAALCSPIGQIWCGSCLDPMSVESELVSGVPVVLGLMLCAGFYRVQAPPHLVADGPSNHSGHAVVAVGLGRSSASASYDLVLIRNSWGARWGDKGHAWLPYSYMKTKLMEFRTVKPCP